MDNDKLRKSTSQSEGWFLKNHPSFYDSIQESNSLNLPWREKLYLHLNNLISPPTCYCGNPTVLININKGYRIYCSTKCQANDKKIREKSKNTCIEKYGVDNPMQNKEIKNRLNKSILDKYGVDNISKLDSIKDKKAKTQLENYGYKYNSQRPEVKEKLKTLMYEKAESLVHDQKIKFHSKLNSKLHDRDSEFISYENVGDRNLKCENGHYFTMRKTTLDSRINNNNIICSVCNEINSPISDAELKLLEYIQTIYNGPILKNDRSFGIEIDIYLPLLKIGFEFNGLYWHSDEYKKNDYHLSKTNLLESNGIHLIYIWEDDWKYKSEIVKSRISNLLGLSNKLGARKCFIKEVNYNDTKEFLMKNHIQGNGTPSKYNIGLYHKGELISLMTFGKLRKNLNSQSLDGEFEMFRFCNLLNTTVIGGASKLFKYFINRYSPKKVISYADRSWSIGTLYSKIGFCFSHFTNPNYHYILKGSDIRQNRFKWRKSELCKLGYDINKTEKQIMENISYRIYDSGSIKYIWTNLKTTYL